MAFKKQTFYKYPLTSFLHILSAVLINWQQTLKMLLEANERDSYTGGLIEHLKIHPVLGAIWMMPVKGNSPDKANL